MSKKSSAKSAKVAATPGSSTKNPATEKALKKARAEIAARIENIDATGGTPNGTVGSADAPAGNPAAGTQPDAATPATPAKGKKGGGKKASAPKPPKAAKPAKEPKAKKEPKLAKAPKIKKVSALDAAAQVLAKAKEPMRSQDLINEMESRGLWKSPGGQTPAATLYAAMLREINAKGKESRFKKTNRGLFSAGPGLDRKEA
jgi:hypothetical protein